LFQKGKFFPIDNKTWHQKDTTIPISYLNAKTIRTCIEVTLLRIALLWSTAGTITYKTIQDEIALSKKTKEYTQSKKIKEHTQGIDSHESETTFNITDAAVAL
jgi:hypothetical protein